MTLEVMGVSEIADRLGKEPAAVSVLIQRGKVPLHDATIGRGRTKVWRRSTIERWIAKEEQV